MKQTKQTMAMIILAVTVGCTSQNVTITPPPPTAEVLHVYSTSDTSPLATIITENNQDTNNDLVLLTHNNTQQNLLSQLNNQEVNYFLTHHLLINTPDYWSVPLVQDGIAILRHQDNVVTNLSVEQLRRIYRGFITNWSELGGDDAEIILYSREEDASIRLEFEQLVMGQQQTSPNARLLSSSRAIIEQLNDDKNAIAYIPISLLGADTYTITIDDILPSVITIADNSYSLRLNIYAIGLQAPNSEYSRLFAWIQNLDSDALGNRYAPLPR